MAFMIGPNETGLRVYNHVNTHQIAQANQLARVASGKEATGDGTGVASLGLLATRSETVEATRTDIQNAQQALGQLNVMEAALTEMAAIAQNGLEASNKSGYAAATGTQFAEAINEIDLNAQFNGTAAMAASTAVVGAVGGGMNFGVTVDATSAVGSIFGADHTALTSTQFTAAITALTTARATVAADIQQMQGTIQALNTTLTNELAAKSQVENNDLAVEMMNLTASQVMVQASSAMLAQAMNTGTEVLRLLNN